MDTSARHVVACPACNVLLRVKQRMLGKRARCPKCRSGFVVPESGLNPDQLDLANVQTTELQTTDTTELRKIVRPVRAELAPPATDRQKEFARSLDCRFADDISSSEIADLIDAALLKKREQDNAERDAFLTMKAKAYDVIRRELQEELADDPQVSAASPRQMVDALGQRQITSVLITLATDDVHSLRSLQDVNPEITTSRHVSGAEAGRIVSLVAAQLFSSPVDTAATS